MMFKHILVFTFCFFLISSLKAGDGDLDLNFVQGNGFGNYVHSVIALPNNQVLVGGGFFEFNGETVYGLARINSDGTLDKTYNDPKDTLLRSVEGMFRLPDGKVLLYGSFNYDKIGVPNVVRINIDGSYDTSFDAIEMNGSINHWVRKAALQSDGKLLLSGDHIAVGQTQAGVIYRMNSDGTKDQNFSSFLPDSGGVSSFKQLSNGKIIVGGSFRKDQGNKSYRYIVRLNYDGSIDSTFNFKPNTIFGVKALGIQQDGKIVLGRDRYSNINNGKYLMRILPNGTLDSSFNQGLNANYEVTIIKVLEDDRLMITGDFTEYEGKLVNRIARLTPSGRLDTTFNSEQGIASSPYGYDPPVRWMDIQSNGDLILSGHFHLYDGIDRKGIARIHSGVAQLCVNFDIASNVVNKLDCKNDTAVVALKSYYGNHPITYKWSTGVNLLNDSTGQFTKGGLSSISATDADGCVYTASIYVDEIAFRDTSDYQLLLNNAEFRTGFTDSIELVFKNRGCLNKPLVLELSIDSLVVLKNFTLPESDKKGDTLVWYLDSLKSLFAMTGLQLTALTAKIGDTVHIRAQLYVPTDSAATSRIYDFYVPIVNAYDPNDITAYPQDACGTNYVTNDQRLRYRIRFQNTGNANAINIEVRDTIDNNLDIESIEVMTTSHSVSTFIEGGNIVVFKFKNIMLPDSMTNESASHGYVFYDVSLKAGLNNYTTVQNRAGIYFDYNPVVLTNTAEVVLHENARELSCFKVNSTIDIEQKFSIYPNPNVGFFTVVSAVEIKDIDIYDQTGKLIKTINSSIGKKSIEVQVEKSGVYFVHVNPEGNTQVLKVVVVN